MGALDNVDGTRVKPQTRSGLLLLTVVWWWLLGFQTMSESQKASFHYPALAPAEDGDDGDGFPCLSCRHVVVEKLRGTKYTCSCAPALGQE